MSKFQNTAKALGIWASNSLGTLPENIQGRSQYAYKRKKPTTAHFLLPPAFYSAWGTSYRLAIDSGNKINNQ